METLDVVTSSIVILPYTALIVLMFWGVILHKLPVIWAWVATAITMLGVVGWMAVRLLG